MYWSGSFLLLSLTAAEIQKLFQDLIRADIVYFETPKGGAVFSVGSITFCGALPINGGDNNVSTMVDNVVRRFLGN